MGARSDQLSLATKAPDAAVSSPSSTPSAPPPDKPAHDVVAGAMARAASQSTIHPLDTMKVRLQAGQYSSGGGSTSSSAGPRVPGLAVGAAAAGAAAAAAAGPGSLNLSLRRGMAEVASLYKGVISAATGAGIIIGAYFAFYSTSKRHLKQHTTMSDGQVAFVSGACAAVGSGVVKVPIAVCIRSVQAGVYANVFQAARSITNAAGVRGLFTGFVPTIMEDVPDMAVKFAVYESLRPIHAQLSGGRKPSAVEDLVMGGAAGAAAAAATTPLDVVKTRMMCSASKRPTFMSAVRGVMAEGEGFRPFFRGVGPRALSNGINSAVFFCFFEAIRQVLVARQQQQAGQLGTPTAAAAAAGGRGQVQLPIEPLQGVQQQRDQRQERQQQQQNSWQLGEEQQQRLAAPASSRGSRRGGSGDGRLACLSLALPLPQLAGGWDF